MMAPVTTTRPVLLQCQGTAKNGKRCAYVFGETDGSFLGKCPKCHSLLRHVCERVQVFPAKA